MEDHGGDWQGKETNELGELSEQYITKFGIWPDGYEGFLVNALSYDEYIALIKYCIRHNKEVYDVVPKEYFLDT